MILTLTANSALDRLLFVEEFVPGTTMRPHKMVDYVGGKGFDTSIILRCLGVDTVALGFVAGETGRRLAHLLDGYGIRHDLVWVEGATRLAHVVVETAHHRHSHLIGGQLLVTPAAIAELSQRYRVHLCEATWVIMAGTLPPNVPTTLYHTWIELAHAAQRPTLLDCAGAPMREALAARPTIVKLNWSEFQQTFGGNATTLAELQHQAQALYQREQLTHLVITCGEAGILALTPGTTYLATAPIQQAVNAAGAGDAVSATLVWRLTLGEDWPTALHWAAAVSAAEVLTEGTAEVHLTDAEAILPATQVKLI
ncbi:MAG: hexose kinase [Caldilineaceae bacterium]